MFSRSVRLQADNEFGEPGYTSKRDQAVFGAESVKPTAEVAETQAR